jgi:hypothetical protein
MSSVYPFFVFVIVFVFVFFTFVTGRFRPA